MDTPNFVQPSTVALRFRAEMGVKKMSRKRLSELTGISRAPIAKKLDGDVPFTYNEVARVGTILGLGPGVLFAPEHTSPGVR